MNAFVEGLIAGLALVVSFGPGFVVMMQCAIQHGFRSALLLLFGIVAGDFLLIALGFFGLAPLLNMIGTSFLGYLTGAVILFIFGLTSLLKRENKGGSLIADQDPAGVKPGVLNLWLKGLIINLTNPLNLVFWVGILAFSGGNYGVGSHQFFLFITGLLAISISADVAKCYMSDRLRVWLTPRVLNWIGKLSGVVFIIAGGIMIARLF